MVVALGSAYKLIQLGKGGRAVAESLGGKLLQSDSSAPLERKVLNIVEEMAIASGNPVPLVYLIEEESINAFAAGFDRRDAVIGVTRGCVKLLTRDELQGVIAHEFSHIHNGDMRLNMRLIAILHGILLIGLIGYYVAHGSGASRYGYGLRRSNRNNGKQVSLGLALMAIGYGGTFFGNIIKAAVSRQREFLADASAVQFTRNPQGISGALKKIGGFTSGSTLSKGNAAEFSHMFFGQGIKRSFLSMMATHPPLQARIKRIEPRWSGRFPAVIDEPVIDNTSTHSESPVSHLTPATAQHDSISKAIDIAGEPSEESLSYAANLINGLPASLVEACHQAFSARAVIYGLLLDNDATIRESQLKQLKKSAHPASYKELVKILEPMVRLPKSQRLPLLSMCIPPLKQLSTPQYHVFKRNLAHLIKSDKKVSIFEWSLYRITIKNIESKIEKDTSSLQNLIRESQELLWYTALAGKNRNVEGAYKKGLEDLGIGRAAQTPLPRAISLSKLDNALNKLEKLKPLEKSRLLKGLCSVITFDNKITNEESELFRAIADTLNCPVPPIFTTK